MSQYTASIQQLYVAYFGRPADPIGLQFWEAQVANANGNTAAISTAFSTSPEYTSTFAGLSTAQIVNQIYQNLFGRTADAGGLLFWSGKYASGALTISNIVTAIAGGAVAGTTDYIALANKTTAAVNFTVALDTTAEIVNYNTASAPLAKAFIASITTDASLAALGTGAAVDTTVAAVTAAGAPAPIVTNFTLTTGVDSVLGGAGNDVFTGTIGLSATNPTLTSLDSINGGAGANVLNISDVSGGTTVPGGLAISNIQTVNLQSAGAATIDTSTGNFTGLTTLNVTRSSGADVITVGDGTSANVANSLTGGTVGVTATNGAVSVAAAGLVTITGGATQTVNTAGGVTLTKSAGAITVVDTAQGNVNSSVQDGTSVTFTTTYAADVNTDNKVTIGATSHLPSGAVVLVENVSGTKSANTTAGDIIVNGGSTVTVTSNATQALNTAAAAGGTATDFTVVQSGVTVNGSIATTAVTVNQTTAATVKAATTALAGTAVTDSVVFSSMAIGNTVTVGGLTFTATAALTAAQAAAAFANLTAGATNGISTLGNYSGTFAGFNSGAATTATVVFTSATTTTGGADVAVAATGATLPALTQTQAGLTAVTGVTGVGGITGGVVNITDANYGTAVNTITSVTESGYGSGFIKSDALTNLSLANSAGKTVSVFDHTATVMNLSVNGLGASSALNLDAGGATYTSLKVTTATANSALAVTGGAVTALTVAGTNSIDMSSSTLGSLKTVVVSGAAGLKIDASGANVTDVNTTATTGAATVTLNAANATYEGGAGVDTVTFSTTTVSKAVSLGAGNDIVTFASGTSALGALVDGGSGVNTVALTAADAAAVTTSNSFAANLTNFQQLNIAASLSGATNVVNLANLNNISFVSSAGSASVTESAVVTWQTLGSAAAATESIGGMTITADGTVAFTAANFATVAAGGTVAGLTITTAPTLWTVATLAGNTDVFTSTTPATNVTDIAAGTATGAGIAPTAAITQGAAATGALTLNHMANAGTLQLTGNGTGAIVTMTDATGSADSFNIILSKSGALSAGTVAVAGVETIKITATDTTTSVVANTNTQTLTLQDSSATSVTITGNAHLTLTNTGNTALTSIDASGMTGGLTVATAGIVAETVKGGAAANFLTAGTGVTADVLIGGAGVDTLTTNAGMDTLTGGAGKDIFVIGAASSNVNSYATITDASIGDAIKFAVAATSFSASQVSLGATAVFQDFANAAIQNTTAGAVSWFQFGGNTYVIDNVSHSTSFVNGTDYIVKLTGNIDLSHTSLSTTAAALLIG